MTGPPAPLVPAEDPNATLIAEFRARSGRVGGRFAGEPIILVTVTGRRTGRRITVPLTALRIGGVPLVKVDRCLTGPPCRAGRCWALG